MRTSERSNLQLILASIIALVFLMISTNVRASVKPISCETNFGEKTFTIQDNAVAFHNENKQGRSISSVLGAATKKSYTGFRKILYKEGSKHLIHIQNREKFDNKQDFLAITSPKGHKMTYPINCSLLE